MKGKILGFNETEGSGAISAEDGSRHRFTRADWRGDKPPAAGTMVDFESTDGSAKDIYPITGAALAALGNINLDLAGLSSSPGGTRVATIFTRTLGAPLGLAVILACFLPAIASPAMSYSLLGLGDAADTIVNPSRMAARMMGEDGGSGGAIISLLFLRFVAPLSAIWLLWTAWTGKSERTPALVTGGSALFAAALVFLLKSAALSNLPAMARDQVGSLISIGLGTWLLVILGGALIAAGLGKLRNPLAKD